MEINYIIEIWTKSKMEVRMGNYKLGVTTSIITIIANMTLASIKIFAGIFGNSRAMIADGIHTLSDILTTLVVILGLQISSKEADREHPYWHERYELVFSKLINILLCII